MRYGVAAPLLVVAIIHLLPTIGMLGSAQLASLYGIAVDEPNLAILMRHRAVLFGIVGVLCVVAAFRPGLQLAALVAASASVLSFLSIAWSVGGYNAALARVVRVDLVALAALAIAWVAWAILQNPKLASGTHA